MIVNPIKIEISLLKFHILAILDDANELHSSVIKILSLMREYDSPHQLQYQLMVKFTTLKIHHVITILIPTK